jgi:chromosome partitioning protein
MGRIVAIANQKGGVGKTTTAINLAASLAVAEQRVLLVDLDPQGNASSGVGHPPRTVDRGTYHVLIDGVPISQVTLRTELGQLDLAASSPDLAAIEMELIDVEERATRLKAALQPMRGSYDFIVVDCPPSLGLLTVNALTAADLVIVPMQCEYYALEGLSQLVSTIERVKNGLNPGLSIHGVVLTMFDPRNNLSREVAAEVRSHFHVYDTVIPRNVRLAEAPSHGRPVILYDSSSRGSSGYLNLAREFLDGLPEAAA